MKFAYEGQLVWVPWKDVDGNRMMVSAVVKTATGDYARCYSKLRGIDRWHSVRYLREVTQEELDAHRAKKEAARIRKEAALKAAGWNDT